MCSSDLTSTGSQPRFLGAAGTSTVVTIGKELVPNKVVILHPGLAPKLAGTLGIASREPSGGDKLSDCKQGFYSPKTEDQKRLYVQLNAHYEQARLIARTVGTA